MIAADVILEWVGAGQHFLHKLGKRANAEVVRAQIAADLRSNRATYQCLWDGFGCDGRSKPSWKEYIAELSKPDSWGGELELLAAARNCNLTVYVTRPNLATITVGDCKQAVWTQLHNKHFDPLAVSSVSEGKAAWKAHVSHATADNTIAFANV